MGASTPPFNDLFGIGEESAANAAAFRLPKSMSPEACLSRMRIDEEDTAPLRTFGRVIFFEEIQFQMRNPGGVGMRGGAWAQRGAVRCVEA